MAEFNYRRGSAEDGLHVLWVWPLLMPREELYAWQMWGSRILTHVATALRKLAVHIVAAQHEPPVPNLSLRSLAD